MIILNDYIIFSPGTRGKRVDYFCIKFHFNPQLRRICFAECLQLGFLVFSVMCKSFVLLFFSLVYSWNFKLNILVRMRAGNVLFAHKLQKEFFWSRIVLQDSLVFIMANKLVNNKRCRIVLHYGEHTNKLKTFCNFVFYTRVYTA